MRVLIGYFIRRTVKDADAVRGKTFNAESKRIYATREQAEEAIVIECAGYLDTRFEHEVAEAYMHVEDDNGR